MEMGDVYKRQGHREPGVIGAAADNQDCMVELIGDGIHIHPVTVRNTFRLFGDSRVCLLYTSRCV